MNIQLFRRFQTTASIVLFIGVFFLCWYVTQFKLTDIQLSFWGVDKKLGWIWNSCVALLSVSIFINVYYFIRQHKRLLFKYNNFSYITFFLTSLFLFLTGVIDMSHAIHSVTAWLYVFAYPLAIFLFAHLNRKHLQYKEWQTHTIFSIAMVVLPLLVLKFFPGMAIPEIIHTIMVIGWNVWILTLE
jgi:hypothetical membrane protein